MIFKPSAMILAVVFAAAVSARAQEPIVVSRADTLDQQFPAGPAGTIQSSTPIHVNGSSAADKGSTTIFVGDKIETARSSAAVITSEGSTVLVPARTTVLFGDNVIDVGCGGALVTTVRGMSARLMSHRVGIYPTDTYAKFELNTAHGNLQIAVREGSVNVVESGTKELPENSKVIEGSGKVLQGLKYTFLTAGSSLIIAGVGCPVAPILLTTGAPIAAAGAGGTVAALAARGNGNSNGPVTPVTP